MQPPTPSALHPSTLQPSTLQDVLTLLGADLPDATALEAAVLYHDHRYHDLDDAIIPDQVYDQLVEALRRVRPESAVLERIGGSRDAHVDAVDTAGDADDPRDPADQGEADDGRVVHVVPMLSLGKCYDGAELRRWAGEWTGVLVASPKVDGAAVSIRYDSSGDLAVAGTRGDGRRGEPIGHNVVRIPSVPSRLPADVLQRLGHPAIEVRGEVYLPLSAFAEVEQLFANPRNVASGVLKAKEQGGVPAERLAFFAYDLLGLELDSELQKAGLLEELGFTPAPSRACGLDEVDAVFAAWERDRPTLDYEIDGVVYKIDAIAEQRRLGATNHHPRWAIAWKLQGDSGESVLESVQWSLSRTGTITPVAIVAPVELSGAMVSRATLHNLSTVERLELRVGDRLSLTRRGGVIPHVEANLGGGVAAVEVPSSCPSCGQPTEVRTSTRNAAGEHVITRTLHCSRASDCPASLRGQLFHYTATLEIDGFGTKLLDALLDAGLVRDAVDLYRLDAASLRTLPRMGETLAAKLLANLDQRRRVPLPTLLVALGIESLGRHAAQLLAARWTLPQLRALPVEELASLHSLGQLTAERIVEGLRDTGPLIDRLLEQLTIDAGEQASVEGPLSGQIVVFTGKLERVGRRDAQQLVVRLGGTAGSSVTAETTWLVVGGDELDADPPSSKLAKARKLAVSAGRLQILSEAEFFARAEGDRA